MELSDPMRRKHSTRTQVRRTAATGLSLKVPLLTKPSRGPNITSLATASNTLREGKGRIGLVLSVRPRWDFVTSFFFVEKKTGL